MSIQATVPFFFLGVCVGLFTVVGLIGIQLGLFALVMSTFVAMVPAVQVALFRIPSEISHSTGSFVHVAPWREVWWPVTFDYSIRTAHYDAINNCSQPWLRRGKAPARICASERLR